MPVVCPWCARGVPVVYNTSMVVPVVYSFLRVPFVAFKIDFEKGKISIINKFKNVESN